MPHVFNRVARTSGATPTYLYRFTLRPDAHRTICRVFETERDLDEVEAATLANALEVAEALVQYYTTADPDPVDAAEVEALVAYLKQWQDQDHRSRTLEQLELLERQRVGVVRDIEDIRTEIESWS
jgi:Fe-S-cluster formation regulator IscX/YfhJ